MKWILLAFIGIVLFLVWHAYTIFGEEEPNRIAATLATTAKKRS